MKVGVVGLNLIVRYSPQQHPTAPMPTRHQEGTSALQVLLVWWSDVGKFLH